MVCGLRVYLRVICCFIGLLPWWFWLWVACCFVGCLLYFDLVWIWFVWFAWLFCFWLAFGFAVRFLFGFWGFVVLCLAIWLFTFAGLGFGSIVGFDYLWLFVYVDYEPTYLGD